jgi:4-alpha-glucanotransferase
MKILQFAFGDNTGTSSYIPHNYTSNFFTYTGTHDNNTTRGWFRRDLSAGDRIHVNRYFGRRISERSVHAELSRLAYSSVAKTVIIPMQDILGLDETARINTPASTKDNWLWRLKKEQLRIPDIEARLAEWVVYYNRE